MIFHSGINFYRQKWSGGLKISIPHITFAWKKIWSSRVKLGGIIFPWHYNDQLILPSTWRLQQPSDIYNVKHVYMHPETEILEGMIVLLGLLWVKMYVLVRTQHNWPCSQGREFHRRVWWWVCFQFHLKMFDSQQLSFFPDNKVLYHASSPWPSLPLLTCYSKNNKQ